MARAISKRTREEAILVCEVRSCDIQLAERSSHSDRCEDLGASVHAGAVSWQAFLSVPDEIGYADPHAEWAEAAAILRDGWRPGDPVYLLTEEK